MPAPVTPVPEQEPQGLLLDRPRLQLPQTNLPFEIFFYTLLTLLGGFGTLACLCTAFDLPLYTAPLIIVGSLYAVLGTLQSLLPRGRVIVFASGALLWGICLLYFSAEAVEGAGRVLNTVLRIYSEKLNFPLRQFTVPEALPAREMYTSTLFALLLLPPFFWLLSWLLARRKNSVAAFSLTGALLSLAMALSILPEFWAICLLLLFWCVLLLSATVMGKRHRLTDEQKRFIVCGAAIRPVLLALLPAAALCMLVVYVLFPQETYTRPHVVNDLRSGFMDGFGLNALFKGGQGSHNDRIDLNGLQERTYSGSTAMRVRYEWPDGTEPVEVPQKDYLKSFVGSVYTGSSWEKLPEEDVRELEEFTAPGQIQNQPAAFSRSLPTESDPDLDYTLSVEIIGANPRCMFTPYGLDAGDNITHINGRYESDGFVRSSNIFSGTHDYQVHAVPVVGKVNYGERLYQHWVRRLFDEPEEAYREAYRKALALHEPILEPLYNDDPYYALMVELNHGKTDSLALFGGRAYTAPVWAKEPLTAAGKMLVDAVERYDDFVYEKYLQLPEGSRAFLDEFRAVHGLESAVEEGTVNVGVPEAFLAKLKAVLSAGYSYTLKPEPVPEGRDFAEYFLTESKTGYCVHFATAAVALCRSAGIPARYVEGYAVPSGNDGVWVDVPDKNAHAWMEVYYSGAGWVPVEVTPVSVDAPATYYNAQAPGTGTASGEEEEGDAEEEEATPSPSPTVTPRPTVAPTASAAPGTQQGAGKEEAEERPLLPLVLLFVGILAMVPVGLAGNRFIRKRWRKKVFSQEDRSKAGLALYGHLLKLQKLEASVYYGERKPPERWEEIALKARFGREMISAEELQELAADAAKIESALKEELPRDRKLYWEYVHGLF